MKTPLRIATHLTLPLSRRLLLLAGSLLMTLNVGCVGSLYQWEAQTRSTVPAPSALLLSEHVAVLPALTSGPQVGFRQALSSALDRALPAASPETGLIPSHAVITLLNTKGLAEPYRALAAGYTQSGVLEQPSLQQVGSALGVRYVFQPTLSSFEQEMEDRFTMFGYRFIQTRTSILRLALQLWDTQTGALVWSASGETTLASDVLRETRIPFELAAEILWKAMIFDLRRNQAEGTYTHLDLMFQTFSAKPLAPASPTSSGSH